MIIKRIHCAVPEKIHTHPNLEDHWKFLEGGESYSATRLTVATQETFFYKLANQDM